MSVRIALLLVCFSALSYAGDGKADALHMALRVENELTGVIEKASSAFAFVGGGSGIVVSADGYILTNHHVAGNRLQWTVRVYGTGKFYVCDLVGTDPVGDLCLLKARDARNIPYVEFGDIAALKIGQQCLTIGDPFKLADPLDGPPSVSLGTISALHRFQQGYSDAIQTDAAINPGNSGGPLVTLDGKLIGITGQIMARFGVGANTGIGYAIPIDQIARFYPILKDAKGKLVYHGDMPQGATFTLGNLEDVQKAVVESVEPDSEAQLLGFRAGDTVVAVEGKPVLNYWRLRGIIQSYPEHASLKILIDRAGKDKIVTMNLSRLPLPPAPAEIPELGLDVELSRAGDGLRVTKIDSGSIAERAGLLRDDVILKIDGQRPINNWLAGLKAKAPGEQVPIQVRRATPTGYVQHTLTMTMR